MTQALARKMEMEKERMEQRRQLGSCSDCVDRVMYGIVNKPFFYLIQIRPRGTICYTI